MVGIATGMEDILLYILELLELDLRKDKPCVLDVFMKLSSAEKDPFLILAIKDTKSIT